MDLPDAAQGDGLDGGAAEAAGDVGEPELAPSDVYRRADERVDQRKGIRPGVDGSAGDWHHVSDIG